MRLKQVACFLGLMGFLTACPTGKPLDSGVASGIRAFGPSAVASSAQFLGGAPIKLDSAIRYVQQGVPNDPKISAAFATLPANLAVQLANPNLRTASARARLTPQMQTALSSHGFHVQAAPNIDCGDSFTDNDGDGIPSLYDYVFDCDVVYNNNSGILSGEVFLKDDNDNNPNSGYQVKLTNLIIVFINPTDQVLVGLQANQNTKINVGASGKFNVSQSYNFVGLRYGGTGTIAFEYSTSGAADYSPNVGANNSTRFAQGVLKFNNNFAFKYDSPTEDYSSELKFLTNGLQVNQTVCGSNAMVSGGDVKFTDNKNSLTWNITGCGDGGWSYN